MRVSIRSGLCAVLTMVAIVGVSATPAFAVSPWWHLTSGSRPSYLKAGVATNEVQEIITSPGAVFELKVGETELGFFESEPYPGLGVTKATAAEVQKKLESVYGAGNVEVTGGPAGAAPLIVTSINGDAGMTVTPVAVRAEVGTAERGVVKQAQPDGQLVVTADNLGDASTSGEVTISDVLPAGLSAVSAEGIVYLDGIGSAPPVKCEVSTLVTCKLAGAVVPYAAIEVRIGVLVRPGAKICEQNANTCERNEVSVFGGGAPGVSISRPVTISEKPTPFGVEAYEVTPEEEGGAPTTQAGRHPFQVTGTLTMNQTAFKPGGASGKPEVLPPALVKDLAGLLPPGLIGNPTPFAKCTLAQFPLACPQGSAIGVAIITYNATRLGGLEITTTPIVNLEPAHDEAARFGFDASGQEEFIDVHVRSGADYGVTLSSNNITEAGAFLSYRLTFWGVPGEASHNNSRGLGCLYETRGEAAEEILSQGIALCAPVHENNPPPFLAMPTACTGPLHTSTEADSWLEPMPEGKRQLFPETEPMPAMDGCNQLPFEPRIKVTPDGTEASTPTGLNVDVHVPQDSILTGSGLAESDVKNITVALPEGVAVNPAGGGGLEACSEGLIGFEGFKEFETTPGVSVAAFTGHLPGSFGSSEALQPGLNFCANASKIGTAKIKTPLLPNPLEGAVYLATQEANPFGSLLAMYVVAEDPESGVLVKLAGQVHLTEAGQLVTTFEDSPQAAFEDAELHFFGGERAPLASPAQCGAYTTNASFVPWAAESWDEAAVTAPASSTFDITSGPRTASEPNGSPCPGATLPFAPALTAQTTSNQAGGFSPFTMTMSRQDGNQHLQAIELKTPPGLSGLLSSVELCPEPQASLGTCGPNSLIGETTVSVGVGGQPFSVKGGRVYITGPYEGAPFGLSIVNPAKAGPFDLENTKEHRPACDCVLVRAKVEVNPITAALTVTSDNTGPFKIPTTLEGIPLQIQHVNVTINRTGFTFNPTDCNKMEITGSLSSTEGATQALSVPFQATNCATLGFAPKFAVSTSGKTSKAKGASLKVMLAYPKARFGSQANIKSVKVDLPKQLPSRLTTLQKACTAARFKANPAGCPASSIVGHAKAITPLVPVPLEGPAYFVSNGGEAFPNLIVVLQGYGVTIDLVGDTFISKAGITSSTFKTIPDAPVGSFELTLPEGKYSALAANGNLCKSKLAMPTAFTAQNGAVIHKSTKISVTGCLKHVRHVRKKSHRKKKK